MSWKDRRRKLQQQTANWLEIPKDIVMDLPKVVMVGNLQVFVENHLGILEYAAELIRIKVSIGELIIRGADLVLRNILRQEILIEGKITGIELIE
jgi:sporulation protein YqfC